MHTRISVPNPIQSDSDSERIPVAAREAIEISVVMPCLNEAETLEACIREAQQGIRDANVSSGKSSSPITGARTAR